MSTRANIVITDGDGDCLWFYRHCDGYPEVTLPSLNKFLEWVKSGKIRDNVSNSSGWLIMIGAKEYEKYQNGDIFEPLDWKVGSYEPTTGQHGDIQYLYTIDLKKKNITWKKIF